MRFFSRDYPCPAGGCLLTDPNIAGRLRDLFAHVPDYANRDLVLLTVGRHFRVTPLLRVVLGRTQEENERLLALAVPGDAVFTPMNFRGPTALAAGNLDALAEQRIGELIPAYSQDDPKDCLIRKEVIGGESLTFTGSVKMMRDAFSLLRIGSD